MGSVDFMQKQIREKIEAGFDTIKLKIAALGFEEELEIIKNLRKEFSPGEITLRVDANGGFSKADALEKLNQVSKVDLVLTDLNMPVMDGLMLVKEVRKLESYKYLPILILTTETEVQKRLQAKDAGATGWLVKPFEQDKLIKVINKVII